jgi:hypothetical protein
VRRRKSTGDSSITSPSTSWPVFAVIIYSDPMYSQTGLQGRTAKLSWQTTSLSATRHSSRTALHGWWLSWTSQSRCLQLLELKVSWLADRYRWTNCLASTPTLLKSTRFPLVKSLVYLSPVENVETLRNQIVAGLQTISNLSGIWIVFGCQRDNELRPVFRQEVDMCNIYWTVMWRVVWDT